MRTIHEVLKGHPGFMYVTIGQVGALLLGAIFWFVMAGLLVPDAYGRVNWLISIAMLASTACVLGWKNTVVTYYPREKKEGLIGGAVALVLIASLGVAAVVGYFVNPLVGMLIVGLSLFSMTISSELGKRRYKNYMGLWIGLKLTSLCLSIVMYFAYGIPGVLAGYAIPHLMFGALSLKYLRRANPGLEEAREKAGFACRAWGVDIVTGSTNLLGPILIGILFGMVTLGLYQLAYQFFMLLGVLPWILFSYLLPEKSYGTETRGIELLGVGLSIVLAVAMIALSPLLIPWIFPKFVESVGLIQIMSFAIIPATIVSIKSSELYAREKPGSVLISYIAALIIGISGILVLGTYFGTIGLAVSAVLLQATLATLLVTHARSSVKGQEKT